VPQVCPAGQLFAGVQPHVPLWQVPAGPPPVVQAVPSALAGLVHRPVLGVHVPAVWHWSLAAQTTAGAVPHTPAAQVAARHRLVEGGQSAWVRHRQTCRPVASLAQTREQQSALPRQSSPGVRQATASARSRPAMPMAAAASPARRRRRLPDAATARARASKRAPSMVGTLRVGTVESVAPR
jgi:hypothetical protein